MSRAHRRLDRRRWDHVRRVALDRDGWRCQCCGQAGRLKVHHVVPLWRDPGQGPLRPGGHRGAVPSLPYPRHGTGAPGAQPSLARESALDALVASLLTDS